MAKKNQKIYVCSECGYESATWLGKCPSCGEWNTLKEFEETGTSSGKVIKELKPSHLSEIRSSDEKRISTHMEEMDRVMGGGIVRGSLILIGGDPGIGKSTLMLQTCRNLCNDGLRLLYISGEESLHQIRMRADRMGKFNDNLSLLCETDLDLIEKCISNEKPDIVVIDSIQTMYKDSISSAPGSQTQVREATAILMRIAKGLGVTVFVIGHVTKEGMVAGPRVLEHMVDTVLYLEGDRHSSYRILRGVKNRFGSTDEIGVFEMMENGLSEVKNPSEFMLDGKPEGSSGSIVSCALEGTRPILVEVQSLVTRTSFGMPRRTAAGFDMNRMNLIMAVIEKRLGLRMSEYDAYLNIAGGMRLSEPAIDLGVVLSTVSSFYDKALPEKLMCFGEVGLSGEVRTVRSAGQRIGEAAKMGFQKCICPEGCLRSLRHMEGIEIIGVRTIREAVEKIREAG